MLKHYVNGTRVINLDESPLDQHCYRRFRYGHKDEVNSLPLRAISPRISIIAAIDTVGNIYMSLTQVNTNTKVFLLYLTKLVAKLTTEDRNWRNKTILLLDGCSYHRSRGVREFIVKQRIRAVISSPYSYDGSPIELFFSLLKRTDLNP